MKIKIIKENNKYVIYDKEGKKLNKSFSNKLEATKYLMQKKFNEIKVA
jgi:hypothetical protein